jgi:hypothetical protein
MTLGSLIIVLGSAPVGMLVAHMAAFRLLRAIGRRPTAHTSAIIGIAACLVGVLAVIGRLIWPLAAADLLSTACLLVYVVAVYGALSVLYLDVVNIAETSLHMHLLLEIAWGDRPSLARLIERYSPERMVSERLARLTALGQVRYVDGRYYLADRSALRIARCIDAWRLVLGLPMSPDEPMPR